MQWMYLPAWLCALGICGAQSPDAVTPEVLLLARIRTQMSQMLERQPNYTCVQEIERSRRVPPHHKFQLVDMLRLEVALVGGKELFAWPGEHKFEDTELQKMVPRGGAIGNGNFALHARNVFGSSIPQFQYAGDESIDGRHAVRYDFRVPQFLSGYRLRVGATQAIVGYHGSFWADPVSLDLIRLSVIADDIPPQLKLKDADDVMDYARVKIGDGDFLLPRGSELLMVDENGAESRNVTRFRGCRQYSGESVLSFGDPPPGTTGEKLGTESRKSEVEIPADQVFDAQLATEIDSDHAMVGDPVKAILAQNIKNKKHVLFPKGSTLIGRILRMERNHDQCIVALEFSELDSDTAHSTIAANVDELRFPVVSGPRLDYSTSNDSPSKHGLLFIHGGRVRLPQGLMFRLRTHTRAAQDTLHGF